MKGQEPPVSLSRSLLALCFALACSWSGCRLHPGETQAAEEEKRARPPLHSPADDQQGRGAGAAAGQQLPYRQLRQVTFGDAGADLHADVDPQGHEIVFASSRDFSWISRAIRRAMTPEFRTSLRGLRNPYGDGRAGERIASRLVSMPLNDKLLRKEFSDS
jgi:hypothetical protein